MPARVLVVDDMIANAKLLEARLTAEYFDVITATSGQEALDICARTQCDIVLLDVMMPGMDGFEVCRRLKADPATRHVPIVMVTALDQPADRVRGLEAGADDFLTKPVSDISLLARVKSLTRLKLMTDELRVRALSAGRAGIPEIGSDILTRDISGRILVVDDRQTSHDRIRSALETRHEIHVETSPQEALFRAAEAEYDLMIVSLALSGFDGLRLCSQVRSLERTRNLPILIVTEPEETARVLRGLDLGVNDYLIRPIDRNELVARVQTQVRRKRYSDSLRNDFQQSVAMALTDDLTGLFNRRYLETQARALMEEASRTHRPLSVIMIDIDHFKSVNDSWGHDVGDEVLREFSRRLRASVRGIDVACRFGGEEFLIVLPDTDIEIATQVGERLRKRVASIPFVAEAGHSIAVTVSVGIATRQENDHLPEQVIKRADQALYRAKREGRNRVAFQAA